MKWTTKYSFSITLFISYELFAYLMISNQADFYTMFFRAKRSRSTVWTIHVGSGWARNWRVRRRTWSAPTIISSESTCSSAMTPHCILDAPYRTLYMELLCRVTDFHCMCSNMRGHVLRILTLTWKTFETRDLQLVTFTFVTSKPREFKASINLTKPPLLCSQNTLTKNSFSSICATST